MSLMRNAAIGLALAAIVWPAGPPKAQSSLAGSEWRVVEIGGTSTPGAGTIRFTQTSIRGRAPCNMYFGAFREGPAGIEIGGINETRMMCEGRMELERAFIDGLARARSYRVEGGTILLLDATGKPVLRLAS
jgi:heat shock protein HslJ